MSYSFSTLSRLIVTFGNTKKLCFSTLGCPNWSFEEILRNAKEMGFSAIEIRGVQEELATSSVWPFRPENEQKAKELLREYGLSIRIIGTSCSFHNKDTFEDALTEGKEAIAIAARMGTPYIRVFGNDLPPDHNRGETIQQVADGLEALCQYSASHGEVGVLLEIHGDFNTIETIEPIIKRLRKYPSFDILWDLEHSYTPYGQDFTPFYELIKPHIAHVHVKDAIRAEDSKDGERHIVLPGEGYVPIKPIVEALERDGYKGFYSFEWEKRWVADLPEPETAFPQYVSYMKDLLEE